VDARIRKIWECHGMSVIKFVSMIFTTVVRKEERFSMRPSYSARKQEKEREREREPAFLETLPERILKKEPRSRLSFPPLSASSS
jgi:hypothetical protein